MACLIHKYVCIDMLTNLMPFTVLEKTHSSHRQRHGQSTYHSTLEPLLLDQIMTVNQPQIKIESYLKSLGWASKDHRFKAQIFKI